FILFENLFKPRQLPSATSKQCFELTSSVLSKTSRQGFEQPAASFLVCFLIFIEYKKLFRPKLPKIYLIKVKTKNFSIVYNPKFIF
ncbi:hypothetical protein, partial [Streptococcus sp. 4094]|uniref:hypothetical protein n=1 Tax=Streptococcus sp. 4094 TaxID=2582652 RepID=UPI0019668871